MQTENNCKPEVKKLTVEDLKKIKGGQSIAGVEIEVSRGKVSVKVSIN